MLKAIFGGGNDAPKVPLDKKLKAFMGLRGTTKVKKDRQ